MRSFEIQISYAYRIRRIQEKSSASIFPITHMIYLKRYLFLSIASLSCGLMAADREVVITVEADEEIGEIRPIWNYFGYDEAGTTLTSEGIHLLNEVNKLSDKDPIRIRVHHLLTSGDGTLALKWSSTNAYTEDENGDPVYNWTLMDQIIDQLTVPGIEPFMQAGFMPKDLSSQPEPYTPALSYHGLPKDMVSGGAFYPPKDYLKWQNLIEAWVRHSVDRYGYDAVSSWLWEPWNEPESPYFKGSVEEYCKLYDHFAYAVKQVVPEARVGGPHVTDPSWKNGDVFMKHFLEHCRSGTNAATGQTGSPIDFIAYHAKGTTRLDEEGRVEMNLRNQLKSIDTYSEIIAGFPEFADLPVYIGESDPEGCAGCPSVLDPERDYRRTSQFASYTAAAFMRKQELIASHEGNLQGAVSWAFTFHDQPWFNGLRALTTNEVALPVFNCFKLFSRLGPVRLEASSSGMLDTLEIIADSVRSEPDIGVVATQIPNGNLAILIWNYHDVAGGDEELTEVALRLRTAESNFGSATITRIDKKHANAYTQWTTFGEPQNPSAEQIDQLHAAATLRSAPIAIDQPNAQNYEMKFHLPRHSVVLIEMPVE